jgi:holo-[acyl-carrier protein] synthase
MQPKASPHDLPRKRLAQKRSEIEVRREPSGKPTLHWTGRALERAMKLGVRTAALTLTHSRDVAMAIVVLED